MIETPAERAVALDAPAGNARSCSPFGVFAECPSCGGEMRPEHAHYRCAACGWRDSCCD